MKHLITDIVLFLCTSALIIALGALVYAVCTMWAK